MAKNIVHTYILNTQNGTVSSHMHTSIQSLRQPPFPSITPPLTLGMALSLWLPCSPPECQTCGLGTRNPALVPGERRRKGGREIVVGERAGEMGIERVSGTD